MAPHVASDAFATATARLCERLRRSRAADLTTAYRRALEAFAVHGLVECVGDEAPADAIGQLYERLLAVVPRRERGAITLAPTNAQRRRGGAFFTPSDVARAIVEEAVPRASHAMRVLDPACGGGAFLLAAARRLAGRAPVLCGIDRDRGAVAATAAALDRALPHDASPRLEVADALAGRARVLDQRYDVIIGNPPYLSVKRGAVDASTRRDPRFQTARGQYDVWSLFVELVLDRLAPHGRYGLVLPRPLLAAESFEPIRRMLFERSRLERVIELGACFPGAHVETVALVGRRDVRGRRLVRIDRTVTPPTRRAGPSPRAWAERPGARIAVKCGDAELAFLAGLERLPARLGDLVTIARGIECGKRDPAVVGADDPRAIRLLTGGDVDRYAIGAGVGLRLDRLPPEKHKAPELFAARPKLLVRRVTDELRAAVDDTGAHALNTLYILRPSSGVSPYALCGWLNSRRLRRYHALAFVADDRLFPYVRASQLRALPVPDADTLRGPVGRRLARAARRRDAAAVDELVDAFAGSDPP